MTADNSELPGLRPDLETLDSIGEADHRRNVTHEDHADGDERVAPDPASSPPRWRELLGPEHRGAAVVLAAGVLVGAVNIYLASSMLPTAVAEIGGEGFYAWNMTFYHVAMVIATMLASRILARRGNAGTYLIGFALFTVGSLACAVSPTMPVLLAGRCLQGLGAGLLSGLGFAVIRSALPRRLWTRGNALMSAMYGVGNFAGPALGGLFAQFASWRLAFVLMAVVATVCGAAVPRVLPRGERDTAAAPVPVVSLVLVMAATAAVSVSGILHDTMARAAGIAMALLLVVGFVAHERRSARRVFPGATYRAGSALKWVYLTLGLLSFGVAVESFVPLFGQRLAGLPPLAAGFFGAAVSLGWSLTQIAGSSAVRERTVRRLRTTGPVLLALGFLVQGLLQREHASIWWVVIWVPVLCVAGSGIGLAYPHLSVAAMSAATDPGEGRQAAAAIATVTTMSTAFGTAVAGVLVSLGGPSTLGSARWLLFGFAVLCAVGIFTARAADRPSRPARSAAVDDRPGVTQDS
ncbi:MFS transporter [Streptomyces platensis]|uniref:MFS transporter n=1 Tax=Streptomyces platensis TaxID=58346 RepID=UPI001F1ED7CC|nr:MFS transporter [Streptomyces platensis]MCF3145913.1 MFS transporter [Streptomyces platensis]